MKSLVKAAAAVGLLALAACNNTAPEGGTFRVRFVESDDEAYDRFYNIIANPMLWFIQHYLWDLSNAPDVRREELDAWEHGYVVANQITTWMNANAIDDIVIETHSFGGVVIRYGPTYGADGIGTLRVGYRRPNHLEDCVLDVLAQKVKTGISHPRLRPTLAVVDPRLTLTQPTMVTAAAGMDILCHALESWTARPYTSYERKEPEQRVPYCGANPIADLWSERFGNFANAIKPLERIAELMPSDTDAVGKLKEIYTKRRQWRQLIDLLAKEASNRFVVFRHATAQDASSERSAENRQTSNLQEFFKNIFKKIKQKKTVDYDTVLRYSTRYDTVKKKNFK